MKIDIFVNAIRNTFFQQNEKSTKQTQTTEQPMMTSDASTTMDFEPKSTKQTQTTEQPMMTLDPSSSTKHRTSNSDTDSAYNTDTDTEHLPRPPRNKKQPKPGTSTRSNTQTTVKQPTRTPAASTYPQHTRKTPLLPTPPAPKRNHYNQHISGPSASRHNIYATFSRPSPVIPRPYYRAHQQHHILRPSPFYNTYPTIPGPANYRYYPQQHIPGPHTAFLTRPYQQTPLPLPAPYQQISGHFQQVYYVPIILPQPLQHYTG